MTQTGAASNPSRFTALNEGEPSQTRPELRPRALTEMDAAGTRRWPRGRALSWAARSGAVEAPAMAASSGVSAAARLVQTRRSGSTREARTSSPPKSPSLEIPASRAPVVSPTPLPSGHIAPTTTATRTRRMVPNLPTRMGRLVVKLRLSHPWLPRGARGQVQLGGCTAERMTATSRRIASSDGSLLAAVRA